jgi:hypothetical protein
MQTSAGRNGKVSTQGTGFRPCPPRPARAQSCPMRLPPHGQLLLSGPQTFTRPFKQRSPRPSRNATVGTWQTSSAHQERTGTAALTTPCSQAQTSRQKARTGLLTAWQPMVSTRRAASKTLQSLCPPQAQPPQAPASRNPSSPAALPQPHSGCRLQQPDLRLPTHAGRQRSAAFPIAFQPITQHLPGARCRRNTQTLHSSPTYKLLPRTWRFFATFGCSRPTSASCPAGPGPGRAREQPLQRSRRAPQASRASQDGLPA